jgi:hypothetical protein
MTRQLKISEDVHFMLTLLKPHDSTSYDEVIRELIENACSYLPRRLESLADLEREDEGAYYAEIAELKQDLYEHYYVEGLIRRREEQIEREKEEEYERYLEEQEREQEEAIDRHIEEQLNLQEQSQKPAAKKAQGIPKKGSEKK